MPHIMGVKVTKTFCFWRLLLFSWVTWVATCVDITTTPSVKTQIPLSSEATSATKSPRTDKPTAKPEWLITNTTENPYVTMSPAPEVKYKMNISSCGAAVLDSSIVFRAELTPVNTSFIPMPGEEYIYQWMSMANMQMKKTYGGLSSEITLVFSSPEVSAGDYPMTVAAFLKRDPAKIIAFETKKFTLTERLNGHLCLEQDLMYQRLPHVFSTAQDIVLTADLHDHFLMRVEPTYNFFWYKNESFLSTTNEPIYATNVSTPVKYTLKSVITVSFKASDESSVNGSALSRNMSRHYYAHDVGKLANTEDIQGEEHVHRPRLKVGHFEQDVMFKDPLWNCSLLRVDTHPEESGIRLGDFALINITCSGSSPSAVCINITLPDAREIIPENETCKPDVFTDSVQHQLNFTLNSTGWHNVSFYIYNDVTRVRLDEAYYGYTDDPLDTPALVLPIVFGILGSFIILIGGVYIMRMRKKPRVEVADFDFHPTLTSSMQSEASVRITKVVSTIKCMFFRDKYEGTHRQVQVLDPSTPLQQDTESRQLYDSL